MTAEPDTEDTFREGLATFIHRELRAAERGKDDGRAAEVVASLAEMLGKSIARVAAGDKQAVEKMVIAAEAVVVETAVDMAETIAAVREMSKAAREGSGQ